MNPLSDDASLPASQPALESEIATIDSLLLETEAQLKERMMAENPAKGVFFAQEIHALQKEKLVLQTRRELRKTHIRRLLFAAAQD